MYLTIDKAAEADEFELRKTRVISSRGTLCDSCRTSGLPALMIGNIRRNYQYKSTAAISKKHAMVVVEDLQVRNMLRSAKGTVEQPGKNV